MKISRSMLAGASLLVISYVSALAQQVTGPQVRPEPRLRSTENNFRRPTRTSEAFQG
jgi:hypothetical protein